MAEKREAGRPEIDDERVVYHGAQAKKENPHLSGWPLAREAFNRADLRGDQMPRKYLDRIAKKIERKIERGEVPEIEPAPGAVRLWARHHFDETLAAIARHPERIKTAEDDVRSLGLDPNCDLGSLRQELKDRKDELRPLWAGPAGSVVMHHVDRGCKTEDEVNEAWAKAKKEAVEVEQKLTAVNKLMDLRSGRVVDDNGIHIATVEKSDPTVE